jgi:hypothetical protein
MGPLAHLKGLKIADSLRLCPSPVTAAEVSAALHFVIPSEAEGPAVRLSSTRLLLEMSAECTRIPAGGTNHRPRHYPLRNRYPICVSVKI